MSLTYPLKNKIIAHMSHPGRWESSFSREALEDETRKWRLAKAGGISAYINNEAPVAEVWHNNGSVVRIERSQGRTKITDESGRVIVAIGSELKRLGSHRAKIEVIGSDSEAGLDAKNVESVSLPGIGMRVGFNVKNGQKIVILPDHSGAKITFAKAITPKERPGLRTRFLHTLPFNREAWGDERFFNVATGAVLVVARDLGIEPDFNYDTPSSFMVANTDDGFEISTSFEHRELVLSHGSMLAHVRNARVSKAVTYKPVQGKPGNLLHLVEQGEIVENHRGQPWHCAVIKSQNAGVTAQHMRAIMGANFGLTGQDSAVISFRKGFTMVAMNQKAHSFAVAAQSATCKIVQAIKTGNIGGQAPIDFLREQFALGANLRRVDSNTYADSKRTLATLMCDNERYDLLEATKELVGLHHLNVV